MSTQAEKLPPAFLCPCFGAVVLRGTLYGDPNKKTVHHLGGCFSVPKGPAPVPPGVVVHIIATR